MMNSIRRPIPIHTLFAALAIAAIPAHAADTTADATAVEVCAATSNGMVPKPKLVKALNRMLDMGDTPAAAKLSKEQRRAKQYDAFWKEFTHESGG